MENDTRVAQVVIEQVGLEFVNADGVTSSLDADLVFDPADPFAVTTVFKTGAQDVSWTFGRELLLDGIYEPTGDGDVHVWPCLSSDGSAVVIIELCSPEGELLVQAHAKDVNTFIGRMLTSVPRGAESALLDLDAVLGSIFA